MMILRRKEIVAAALVVLIGMAGYLNWHYQDTLKVTDGESYIEAGKRLGEAQYVSTTKEGEETEEVAEPLGNDAVPETLSGDYFQVAYKERENSRAKSLEILNQTAANESFDKEIRKKAQEQILKTSDDVLKENTIENVAHAKGYKEICAFISEDDVSVTVKKDGFSENDVVKIQEIVTSQLKISPNKVKIIEVK